MITFRRVCGLLVVVLICSFAAISTPTMQNTPEARIDELRQQFNLAYNAGNAADLARLFAEDGVLLPPGTPAAVGRHAIQARFEAQFAVMQSSFALYPGEIRVSSDIGWLRGGYQRVDTPISGGPSTTIIGKYLMTFSRERGDWKITTDAWNTNQS